MVDIQVFDAISRRTAIRYERLTYRAAGNDGTDVSKFTWAKNPDWNEFYSSGGEIQQYVQEVVDVHDLRKFFQVNHQVVGAEWKDDEGVWEIKIKNLLDDNEFTDKAEIFINNEGLLKYVYLSSPSDALLKVMLATGDGHRSMVFIHLRANSSIPQSTTSRLIFLENASP